MENDRTKTETWTKTGLEPKHEHSGVLNKIHEVTFFMLGTSMHTERVDA